MEPIEITRKIAEQWASAKDLEIARALAWWINRNGEDGDSPESIARSGRAILFRQVGRPSIEVLSIDGKPMVTFRVGDDAGNLLTPPVHNKDGRITLGLDSFIKRHYKD